MTPTELRDAIVSRAVEITKRSSSPAVDQWAAEIVILADEVLTVKPPITERRSGRERRNPDQPDHPTVGDRRLMRRVP